MNCNWWEGDLTLYLCTYLFRLHQLIQEHLQHDSPAGNSSGESFTSSSLSQMESGQGVCIHVDTSWGMLGSCGMMLLLLLQRV